jgi:uncharacterized protein (TIGR03437 family)
MKIRTGCLVVLAALFVETPTVAQLLGNQSVSGKFFFRHISLGTDGSSVTNLSDSRSLMGTLTFDGSGRFTFVGQQVTGTAAPASASGSGAYSVDPGGFVTMDNPIRSGAKINARYSTEALLGSSTESADNAFDLFIAVPAPSGGAVLGGPYTTVDLEFPGAVTTSMRANQFTIDARPLGNLAAFALNGHLVSSNSGAKQQFPNVSGATFTMGVDGTGSFTVPSNTQTLLTGTRTLYISASGNIILGGSASAGAHDIVIGVKASSGASNATWNSTFWASGLRVDGTSVSAFSGGVAARGQTNVTWTRRIRELAQGSGIVKEDFTGANLYTVNADSTGSIELTAIGLGAGGKLLVGVSAGDDPTAYEVLFGVQAPSLNGTGVFLNPLGVINAASFAPPGNPISPGQFVALFGTGLAASTATAKPPYPTANFNGVTVQINGKNAPIYFVSSGQINVLVPFSTAGPTATIVVQNAGATSNTVTVPVAATAPGVYSLDSSGLGSGAILHADFSLVNDANPAAAGETVLIYLTGMGTTNPTVPDGTAGTVSTLYKSVSDVGVYVAGNAGTIAFNGLAPGFPGLYQINVTLPTVLPKGKNGRLPLAISTGNAFHDQVDISIK